MIDLSATKIRLFSETSKLFPKIFAKKFYAEDLEKMRSIIFDICDGKQDSAKATLRSSAKKESECNHYEVSISVVSRGDNGLPTSLMGIQHDVTEDYRRQEKIRQLLLRYHTIFNSSLLDNIKKERVFSKDGDVIWQCSNCGHIVIGKKAPEECPVCNHPQAYFQVKAENY